MVTTFLPFIKLALITRLDETNHLAKFESFHIEPLYFCSGRDKTLDSAWYYLIFKTYLSLISLVLELSNVQNLNLIKIDLN